MSRTSVPKLRRLARAISTGCLLASFSVWAGDKLQVHFIDVGQADAELIVSPGGQTLLIDGGLPGSDKVVNAYLRSNGISRLDYYVASHYHRDHIGSATKILTPPVVSKLRAAYDRGDSPTNTDAYGSSFSRKYRAAVSGKRITARTDGAADSRAHGFILDASSNQPVRIEFFAVNGNGLLSDARRCNENDLSVGLTLRFGAFSAVLGGDLSGSNGSDYTDVETPSAVRFTTPVTVYKVHHHGSGFSSNTNWLRAINPVIGVICCGRKNGYGLPEEGALDRLAAFKIATYWTESGAKPSTDPGDARGAAHLRTGRKPMVERFADPHRHQQVGGDIRVEVAANANTFALITSSPSTTNTFSLTKPAGEWATPIPVGSPPAPQPQSAPDPGEFVWSPSSTLYHIQACPKAKLISPNNKQHSFLAPPDRRPHSCVGN